MYLKALASVQANAANYTHGELHCLTMAPSETCAEIERLIKGTDYAKVTTLIENKTEATDFCSQINFGVNYVQDSYFSILEFDDEYIDNWFEMAHAYYYTNEEVSVFLPINIQYNTEKTLWQYGNELAWAASFSDEMGFVDAECLKNSVAFNLTGGIFNTTDFKTVGGLKPSIKIAFNYEFLLRLAHRSLKTYVVPKEGYKHLVGRKGSLTDIYADEVSEEESRKWFTLAETECAFVEDRGTGIDSAKSAVDELK